MDELVPGVLKDAANVNQKLKLLWIGCGDLDPRHNGHLDLVDQLKARGLHVTWKSESGGHEWKVWRHQLAGFLRYYFGKCWWDML